MVRLKSSLFRRPERTDDVRPGHSFLRHGRALTEKATVLDLRTDPAGIPHVRFKVIFERKFSERVETGLKVLALQSFLEAYPDRIA
jgi:hypothetical protein